MLDEGLRLMVVGMSTVFAMLALLVALMHASAAVFARLPADDELSATGEDGDALLVAVALAAAQREREREQ